MKINSLLPPVSFQSVTDGKFYIVTTDKKLGMRFGQLNEDAKLAKDTLQNYFTDKFGQPASVEIRL